mmetsp:Transcript_56139/g.99975  ORF Transcript_56139/g.99975 Transcript_56139/m.99975 type:complete len:507 (+) Transcript_56139:81-1601(+)
MSTAVVQACCSDNLKDKRPLSVQLPLNHKSLVDAAAKKYKAVSKQSHAYHGLSGQEIFEEIGLEDLVDAFVVFAGKGGWKGALRLQEEALIARSKSNVKPSQGALLQEGLVPSVFPWLLREGPAPSSIQSGQREQIAKSLRAVPAELHGLLPLLTDTHNHMAGYGRTSRKEFNRQLGAIEDGAIMHAKEYCVVTVEPEDWEFSRSWSRLLGAQKVSLRPAIGIHPQCASDVRPEGVIWLEQMREILEAVPGALVGEIGLDRNAHFKPFFESHQQAVFLDQLRLAAEFHRPVSVHCVKADAAMVEVLKKEISDGRRLPPTICMHSFAGSIETANVIIRAVEGAKADRCRVFFGFNAWTNLYKKDIARLVIGLMEGPLGASRFIVESDWNPADFAFPGSDKRDIDKILLWGVAELAEILGMDPKSMAELTAANTRLFLEPLSTAAPISAGSGYPEVDHDAAFYSLTPALQQMGLVHDELPRLPEDPSSSWGASSSSELSSMGPESSYT